jgi:hypothetical protein
MGAAEAADGGLLLTAGPAAPVALAALEPAALLGTLSADGSFLGLRSS